ncbi:MAG: fasciclin domain-containing protein [Ilumatobacter sp.]|nr:MAG: fasciclin domain-containing protein [Ilumatobacter sp.]
MKRSTTLRSLSALAVVGALTLSACGDDANDDAAPVATDPVPAEADPEAPISDPDIVEIAATTEGFSTLVVALSAADLVETLQGEGPFTVFAPTDEAFAALPDGLLDSLLEPENSELLTRILTYHVVAGDVRSGDIEPGAVATVEGSDVTLDTADGVTVDGANVIQADIVASNGVIHVIDAVILPADIAESL